MSKKQPSPLSAADRKALADYGCTSWTEYVKQQAKNFGVPYEEAATIFAMMGKSEAFDGFVTMMEDRGLTLN